MRQLFDRLFRPAVRKGRSRLSADQWPAVVYAIGDVHGCRAELDLLERRIIEDAAAIEGEKWIVMLGDYVDRGPRSAEVLDYVCASPTPAFRRICLVGNHEAMMLDFIRNPQPHSDWLRFGGIETLQSYGVDLTRFRTASAAVRLQTLLSHIPSEHIEMLETLPASLTLPGVIFVHAGIRPGIPIAAQSDEDMMWIREPFLSHADPLPLRVVHGHTPIKIPEVLPYRIGIDTGAYATGILTALRLTQEGSATFIDTPSPTSG